MKRFSVILLIVIWPALSYACEGGVSRKESIDIGNGWRFRRVGEDMWHGAEIPGCIHTDLLSNGLIEDPFYRDNEERLQWIESEDWEYETSFYAGASLLARENIELCFEGLDTYADVYLNDSLLFSADNMFRGWTVGCKGILKGGRNSLRVYFHSPVEMEKERWNLLDYELPGGPRVLTRKSGYHYGWDWGPRLVTSGIWKPVYLVAWDVARIRDLQIIQNGITEKEADLSACISVFAGCKRRAEVSISLGQRGEKLKSACVELFPGENAVRLDFRIDDPELWWTNGLGEPHLYVLLAELSIDGGVVDDTVVRIGIRTIELVRERDESGERFFFELNGVPVFMKGANYIPRDNFVTRVTRRKYEDLVESASRANMNMLRVWGGGIYENDIFYDLCDERGILVWQDFMFACAMYPGDEAFLKNVELEAIQTVKRLRNHPCIALWCGNNEIGEGWHNWGWQDAYGYSADDSSAIWEDYEELFHRLLPEVVAKYDPAGSYWPSSPKYGRADPRSLREGDSHYWGVWHDGKPFEAYRENVGRFMSEYGFQSFPEFGTIRRFSVRGDWDLESEVMLSHQKHPRGNQIIRDYMERNYMAPKDFESFLYLSQILQAEGIKTGIEAHRRAMPHCMGTLYWQLNDCWPAASWSGIDYYGNWKALHYFTGKAFSDILVSPFVEGETLRVYIVSDRQYEVAAELRLELLDFSGRSFRKETAEVKIPPNSSGPYFEIGVGDLLGGLEKSSLVLSTEVGRDEETLSENLLYFLPPKELALPEAEISVEIERSGVGYTVSLCTDKLVKGLYLHIVDSEGFFTDNYFDLLPGARVDVEYITESVIDSIEEKIKTVSLVDTY